MEKTYPILTEFANYLRTVKKMSPNSVSSYTRDARQMLDYMSENNIVDLVSIREDDVSGYEKRLFEDHMAPSSVSRHVVSIKSFFHFLVENGDIKEDVSETLVPPKVVAKPPKILSNIEIEELMDQDFGSSAKGLRDKAMLELMYSTGIRVSEIIALKIDDFDLQIGTIRCTYGKDKTNTRVIPYGRKAKDALRVYIEQARRELLKGSDTELMFVNCDGKAMSRQGFWKILKSYSKKAGIGDDISPVTLRHSFGMHLITNGADISDVKEMLGHSDIYTTARYVRNNKKAAEFKLNRVDR